MIGRLFDDGSVAAPAAVIGCPVARVDVGAALAGVFGHADVGEVEIDRLGAVRNPIVVRAAG